MNLEKRFPIKTVAHRSGLSTHVIRAWEKRYQVVKPSRTETNRRLYSEADIYRLSLLKVATQSGHSISSIADMDINALERLLHDQDENLKQFVNSKNEETGETDSHFQKCLDAIKNFNSGLLEESLMRASLQLSQPVLVKSLIIPLLNTLGDQWKEGSIRIMHEHMATAIIKPFLHNLRISYRPAENAPSLIIATPTGQIHEIGALIVGLVAASEGWRVEYLGPNLPAEEIALACNAKKARYVLLSIVYPANDPFMQKELEKLRSLINPEVNIIIGGRGSDSYSEIITNIGAILINDLDEVIHLLEANQ